MTEITNEASEEFVQKVKELLETITGKPYSIAQKEQLVDSIWGVYLDEDKVSRKEGLLINYGTYWVIERNDRTIYVFSDRFYNVNDIASENYGLHLWIRDDLLEKKNWVKYRKKVPGLIAELEAAERIADKMNRKYGLNINLCAREKPYFETSFNARGMNEDEKLYEIGKHARAIHETWGTWREWAGRVGRDIYSKTSKKRLRRTEYVDMALSSLKYITGARYDNSCFGQLSDKLEPGIIWAAVGDSRDEKNMLSNRGVWFVKETRDGIILMSDNLETISARSLEEYMLIQQIGGKITVNGVEGEYKRAVISPEIVHRVIGQVREDFKVKIQVRKDGLILVTDFMTSDLGPYGKLYEIDKHARALVEAWRRIREMIGS